MNAVKNRPIFIDEDTLVLRIGMRWRIRIPYREIASCQILSGADIEADRNLLKAMLSGEANLLIELKKPFKVQGLYGISREVRGIVLFIDEPGAFIQAHQMKAGGEIRLNRDLRDAFD